MVLVGDLVNAPEGMVALPYFWRQGFEVVNFVSIKVHEFRRSHEVFSVPFWEEVSAHLSVKNNLGTQRAICN